MIIIYVAAYRFVLMIIIRLLAFKKIDRYKVRLEAAFITTPSSVRYEYVSHQYGKSVIINY